MWQGKSRTVMAEIGFGSGLNFLRAWTLFEQTASHEQHLYYYAFEQNPLATEDILKQLAPYSSEFTVRLDRLIADYPLRIGGWHTLQLSPQVTLTFIIDDVKRALPQLNTPVDAWLLNEQPQMFDHIERLSRKGTRLSAPPATDNIQRELEHIGFEVSASKNMITGVFQKETRPTFYKPKPQKIAIIGGGIAGAAMSHALVHRKCDVTIFEKNALAAGGSGNDRGLCNPRISSQRGGEADFYSPAFNLAYNRFRKISKDHDIGFSACGSLHLMSDEAKHKRYHSFVENWGWNVDHARIINEADASDIAGVPISQASLYMPQGSMVSPYRVTHYLSQSAKIILKDISSITASQSGWAVDGDYFDCVILCGGYDVLKFAEARTLPLEKIRGQITKISATDIFSKLKTNLCYGGYASAPENGEAFLGSTFQKWMEDEKLRVEDDEDNLSKLKAVAPHLAENLEVIGGRASFRCAANDRAPVIGQIHDAENLYISTAHGSHGILSSLMGAEFLAAKICGEPQILPQSTEKYLSPSRFKKKNI